MRIVMLCLFVLVSGGLVGCGTGSDKPAAAGGGDKPASAAPPPVVAGSGGKTASAADARKELMDTAKQMDGPFAIAVKGYVESVENGSWPWSMADNEFLPGKFTPETIAAYKKWRAAKLAEDKAKKK